MTDTSRTQLRPLVPGNISTLESPDLRPIAKVEPPSPDSHENGNLDAQSPESFVLTYAPQHQSAGTQAGNMLTAEGDTRSIHGRSVSDPTGTGGWDQTASPDSAPSSAPANRRTTFSQHPSMSLARSLPRATSPLGYLPQESATIAATLPSQPPPAAGPSSPTGVRFFPSGTAPSLTHDQARDDPIINPGSGCFAGTTSLSHSQAKILMSDHARAEIGRNGGFLPNGDLYRSMCLETLQMMRQIHSHLFTLEMRTADTDLGLAVQQQAEFERIWADLILALERGENTKAHLAQVEVFDLLCGVEDRLKTVSENIGVGAGILSNHFMSIPTGNEEPSRNESGRYSALNAFTPFHVRKFLDGHFRRVNGRLPEVKIMHNVAKDLSQGFLREIGVMPKTRRSFEKVWALIWKDPEFLACLRIRLTDFRDQAQDRMNQQRKKEQNGLMKRITTSMSNQLAGYKKQHQRGQSHREHRQAFR